MQEKKANILHFIFQSSIFIKGIDGIGELIGSILLFTAAKESIIAFVQNILSHELIQDPSDPIANYLLHLAQNMSLTTQLFSAFYLLIHGTIKVGLVTALWHKQHWAYPVAGIILSMLCLYKIFRFFTLHSYLLLFFTCIDIIIIALLRFEYKRIKRIESNKN